MDLSVSVYSLFYTKIHVDFERRFKGLDTVPSSYLKSSLNTWGFSRVSSLTRFFNEINEINEIAPHLENLENTVMGLRRCLL